MFSFTIQHAIMFGFFRRRRRPELREQPFPAEWLEIVNRNFPLYQRLPPDDQKELLGDVQVFLAEKRFEGCDGLEITDEIRVTIAVQACMLLLHRETDFYDDLRSILVYPSAFVSSVKDHSTHGIVTEGRTVRLGEAWREGYVVLSWDDVRQGAADFHDGSNVVFHEFAHQLDQEDGDANGAPELEQRSMYIAWARVLGATYEQLQKDSRRGRKDVIDSYGATNPAEFFAVATETFFEKPHKLKMMHPELYDELMLFYQQDPESYVEHRPSEPEGK